MNDYMSDLSKTVGDALSVGIVIGAIVHMLPAIAAVLTIIWTGLRIYETTTVQKLFRRK